MTKEPGTFSEQYPLQLSVQIRNNNVVSNSPGRSITSIATSWGTATRAPDSSIAGTPVGSVDESISWKFVGTLPGAGLGDNEADLRIGFGDGISGLSRWTDYITVTPQPSSGAPLSEDTGAINTTECRDYYNQWLSGWTAPFQFYAYGPLNGYDVGGTNGGIGISAGTSIDSRRTGNFSAGGSASQDGIW